MSARELPKLTERGLQGQIMDAAWSKYGGNLNTVDFWEMFGEGVEFTLSALTAAGYRIVPPGGLDAETELRKAVQAVQDATAAYLPPDGIDAQECLNRILQATDNPTINAITLGAQYGRP